MDGSTTQWIMVAVLLLLIGAAIFVLLRRPGGQGTDHVDDGRDTTLDQPAAEEPRGGATATHGAGDPVAPAQDPYAGQGAPTEKELAHREMAEHQEATGRGRGGDTGEDRDDTGRGRSGGATAHQPVGDVAAPGRDRPADDVAAPGQAAGSDLDEEQRDAAAEQEFPTDQGSTTYRADDGDVVVLDDEAGTVPGTERSTYDAAGPTTRSDPGHGADVQPPSTDEAYTAQPPQETYQTQPTEEAYQPTQEAYPPEPGTDPRFGGEPHPDPTQDPLDQYPPEEQPLADESIGAAPEEPVFTESIYGAGTAEPLGDGTGPAGWEIKGNSGSMLFHTPDSPSYASVRAEVWFESEEVARSAGFAHWDRRRR